MEEINPYDELMIRVLDGYATETEERQLNNWLKESPTNQTTYDEFQRIWTGASNVPVLNNLDIEADLKAVKVLGNSKLTTNTKDYFDKSGQPAKLIPFPFLRKIAAVLLPLAVIATALFLYFNQSNTLEPILLSDGTKVWLYEDANLEYPEQFATTNRLVKLTGEAFFEVAKDVTKPFIIEAGNANIQVLGTSFNVQSEGAQTDVIVNSGKVKLYDKNAPEKAVELTKGEKGIYQNTMVSETINTDKNYRAWQNGVFEFDGTVPIDKVVEQLSKYYGAIEINTATNQDCLLDAAFHKEELSTILEVIRSSCTF